VAHTLLNSWKTGFAKHCNKGVDYIANKFSYPLARVGTRKLRQHNRQIPDSTVGVSKVSNNFKEAVLAISISILLIAGRHRGNHTGIPSFFWPPHLISELLTIKPIYRLDS
jgi:hypothetical protein